jgi:hypothetical protein
MVKTIRALVEPGSTTLQMMQKLRKKKGIPIHEMQLWYNNRQLEEDKLLSFYGITSDTHLTLKTFKRNENCPCPECKRKEQKIKLTVTWLLKSIQVECILGETIEQLKHVIWKREGIAVAKQRLTFDGQTLQDHKLLSTYKFGVDDEESGASLLKPQVHLFVDNGMPSVMEKLRSLVSFRATPIVEPTAPATI